MPGFQPSFLRHLAPIMPDHRRALCPVRRGVITGIRPYARYHPHSSAASPPPDASIARRPPATEQNPPPADQFCRQNLWSLILRRSVHVSHSMAESKPCSYRLTVRCGTCIAHRWKPCGLRIPLMYGTNSTDENCSRRSLRAANIQ